MFRFLRTFLQQEVVLNKEGGPLGLSIIGGIDQCAVPYGGADSEGGVFISQVVPGGVASNSGCLRRGDRILAVNGAGLEGMSLKNVVYIEIENSFILSSRSFVLSQFIGSKICITNCLLQKNFELGNLLSLTYTFLDLLVYFVTLRTKFVQNNENTVFEIDIL